MTTAAIIVAAGRGTRAGGDLPKQWQTLAGRTVAAHAMQRFADHPRVAGKTGEGLVFVRYIVLIEQVAATIGQNQQLFFRSHSLTMP